jgi:phenylacetate-CoA ligase/benzoylacetate-CoA ligase
MNAEQFTRRRADRPEEEAGFWDVELETLPWPDLTRWQARAIAQSLDRVRQRSDLYRRLYASLPADCGVRTLADLEALPFTVKEDVRAAQDASTSERPFGANQVAATEEIVQAVSSSGTTGRPLYYGLTARDVEVWTDAIAQCFFTAGVRKSDIVAHLVALPMVAGGLPYADGLRRIGATLCWLGGFPTERILREICQLRVTAVLATTSYGAFLGEQWRQGSEAERPLALSKVLCGGEPGLNQAEIRARIRDGLGIEHLREVMGLGDVISAMWGECQAENGMHFNAQRYVAIELIEPETGRQIPWSEGAVGELVYTCLARDATPLVRYRSRDHIQVIGVGCACGRTSPRIRCIGRTDDMLIYKGMNVFPTAIRDLLAARFARRVEPHMRIWKESPQQVRFDDPIAVDVEVIPELTAAELAVLRTEIESEVRSQLQVRISVSLLPRGAIPRNAYKNSLLAVRSPKNL